MADEWAMKPLEYIHIGVLLGDLRAQTDPYSLDATLAYFRHVVGVLRVRQALLAKPDDPELRACYDLFKERLQTLRDDLRT